MELLHVTTREQIEFLDITDRLTALISRSALVEGIVNVQALETMTATAIDDSGERGSRRGDCRALPLTNSVCLNVAGGRLVLGTSQRVLMVELDGPQDRTLSVVMVAVRSADLGDHEHPRDSWIERRFSEALGR